MAENAYYPGSLEPLDFGELAEHGFYEVDTLSGSVKFMPFALREFIIKELAINEDDEFEDIINKFEKLNDKDENFYRIILKGSINKDLNINRIISLVKDKFYYLEVINNLEESLSISTDIYEKILAKAEGYPDEIRQDAINIALKAMQSREHYYED